MPNKSGFIGGDGCYSSPLPLAIVFEVDSGNGASIGGVGGYFEEALTFQWLLQFSYFAVEQRSLLVGTYWSQLVPHYDHVALALQHCHW
jgi:hypothetical protein